MRREKSNKRSNLLLTTALLFPFFTLVAGSLSANDSPPDQPPPPPGNFEIAQEIQYSAGHAERPVEMVLARSRGLLRFPIHYRSEYVSACRSFHYNPDRGLVDAYAQAKVACNFLSILQDWRENDCPDHTQGCRIAWGDISHKTRKYWNGHRTHTNGYCIDLRPLRSGEFENKALWWCEVRWRKKNGRWRAYCTGKVNPEYSRSRTEALLRKFKANGSTIIYFNDPVLIRKGLARRAGGHDNHIHVCFGNNNRNDRACGNYRQNETLCNLMANGEMR